MNKELAQRLVCILHLCVNEDENLIYCVWKCASVVCKWWKPDFLYVYVRVWCVNEDETHFLCGVLMMKKTWFIVYICVGGVNDENLI